MVRGQRDGENGAGEQEEKELTGSEGILTGMGEEGEALGGLKRGQMPRGSTPGGPSRKGLTVVASRAKMAVKKAGSGGYGESDSKRRHKWAFNSIERRLVAAFCLSNRTPTSGGVLLRMSP